jgi:hypothetical protein
VDLQPTIIKMIAFSAHKLVLSRHADERSFDGKAEDTRRDDESEETV